MSVAKNLLVAFDQLLNCCFRFNGEWGAPDETLSARAWRVRDTHPRWHQWIDRLFFTDRAGEKRHCQLSYEAELLRAHLPDGYRK
jgi:hypothetical protein